MGAGKSMRIWLRLCSLTRCFAQGSDLDNAGETTAEEVALGRDYQARLVLRATAGRAAKAAIGGTGLKFPACVACLPHIVLCFFALTRRTVAGHTMGLAAVDTRKLSGVIC